MIKTKLTALAAALVVTSSINLPAGNTVFYNVRADKANAPIYEGGIAVRRGRTTAKKGKRTYRITARTFRRTRKGPSGTLRYMGNSYSKYSEALTRYIEKHIGEKEIDISRFKETDGERAAQCTALARMRHPEYSCLTGTVTCTYENGVIISMKPERIRASVSETDRAAEKIAAKARKLKGTARKVQYVRKYLSGIKYGSTRYSYSAYGALVRKKAVCEGKSEAFYLIMKKLHIPVRYDDEPSRNHIWNQVKIGRRWYAVDTTWSSKRFIYDETLLLGKKMR